MLPGNEETQGIPKIYPDLCIQCLFFAASTHVRNSEDPAYEINNCILKQHHCPVPTHQFGRKRAPASLKVPLETQLQQRRAAGGCVQVGEVPCCSQFLAENALHERVGEGVGREIIKLSGNSFLDKNQAFVEIAFCLDFLPPRSFSGTNNESRVTPSEKPFLARTFRKYETLRRRLAGGGKMARPFCFYFLHEFVMF